MSDEKEQEAVWDAYYESIRFDFQTYCVNILQETKSKIPMPGGETADEILELSLELSRMARDRMLAIVNHHPIPLAPSKLPTKKRKIPKF